MGKIILCETKEAEKEYYFESKGIKIISYEELCYYIYNHAPIFYDELTTFHLIEWIRKELNLEELADRLTTLKEEKSSVRMEMRAILEAFKFYTDIEVAALIRLVDNDMALPKEEYLKKMADQYANFQCDSKAVHLYDKILGIKETKENRNFIGNIYHNRGLCLARNLELAQAKSSFIEAFTRNTNKESLQAYFLLLYVCEEDKLIRQGIQRFGLPMQYYSDFIEEMETAKSAVALLDISKRLRQAQYNKEKGQPNEYDKRFDCILETWKQEYRIYMN